MVDYITDNIIPSIAVDIIDRARWMGNTSGTFTIKSAYKILRRKRQDQQWTKSAQIKGLPPKIDFFSL